MSSTYNLNEQVGEDYFKIVIDEHTYIMTYPSSRDLIAIQEMTGETVNYQEKIEKLKQGEITEQTQKEINSLVEKAKLSQDTFLDWCIRYITSESENAPNFKELLLSKNVKFLLAFVKMVQKELSD